jgi:hypothetical protein
MKRVDIEKAYGGETAFTRAIANDFELGEKLLRIIGEDGNDITITDNIPIRQVSENSTSNKRPDNVGWKYYGTPEQMAIMVAEVMLGRLDDLHMTKILKYSHGVCDHRDKYVKDLILVCEKATEEDKEFIDFLNRQNIWNITIVVPFIVKEDNGKVTCVDFEVVHSPRDADARKKQMTSTSSGETTPEFWKEFADKHPKYKINPCKSWCNSLYYWSDPIKYQLSIEESSKDKFTFKFTYKGDTNGSVMQEEDIFSTVVPLLGPNCVQTDNKKGPYVKCNSLDEAFVYWKKVVTELDGDVNLTKRN